MIRKHWRDFVSRLTERQQPPEETLLPEDILHIYKCRSCSGDLLYVGVEPQSECPHCGRRTLELQDELMSEMIRRARSMLEVSRALKLFQQQDLAGAIEKLKSATDLDPDNKEAHYNLGEVYFQDGKVMEAINATRRALELDESDVMAHINLGTGLMTQGKTEEALIEYDRAVELDPNNALARFNRGRTLLLAMRTDEACEDWHKYLELEPRSERADVVRSFFQRFGG